MTRLHLEPVMPATWDRYVANCPASLIFHTARWLDLLARVYCLEWQPLGIWSGRKLTGLFPLMTRRLGPFQLAGSPLMQVVASTPFLGPLVQPADLADTLQTVEEALRISHIAHMEIAFPGPCPALGTAVTLGYVPEECQTVVLPLAGRTRDQLWRGLSGACRRAVAKAQTHSVQVVEAPDGGIFTEYYRMCEEVYRGSGRTPHLSQQFYVAAWEALAERGEIKVLLAVLGNRLLAGAVFLLYGGAAYYLSGASYHEALPLRPNNLIQWHFITWAAGHGIESYDFGGAVVPGITRFKLSFGAELQRYSRLYQVRSPVARLGRQAYAWSIPGWRKLKAHWRF